MDKVAYEQGAWQALVDTGIVKTAAVPPQIAQALEWLATQGKNVSSFAGAAKAPLIGAGLGGVAGAVGGGDLQSALLGAAGGGLAGAAGGGQLAKLLETGVGKKLTGKAQGIARGRGLGETGRAAQSAEKGMLDAATRLSQGKQNLPSAITRGQEKDLLGAVKQRMSAERALRGSTQEALGKGIRGLGYGTGGGLGLAALAGGGE